MRALKIIAEEIKDLDALINDLKEVAKTYAEDQVLAFNLVQYNTRKDELTEELSAAFKESRSHIFDVAIQTDNPVKLSTLSKLFDAIQLVMNAMNHAVKIATTPNLYWATQFNGSFGIRTNTETDNTMVLSDYTLAFSSFFELNEMLKTNADVLEVFKNDRKFMRRFEKYLNELGKTEYPIRISWGAPDTTVVSMLITPSEAFQRRDKLRNADTIEAVTIELVGSLLELNLINSSFIILAEGKSTTIRFDGRNIDQIQPNLGKRVKIHFRHERSYDFEKEATVENRTLIDIAPLSN
jgi:hypothetical protein